MVICEPAQRGLVKKRQIKKLIIIQQNRKLLLSIKSNAILSFFHPYARLKKKIVRRAYIIRGRLCNNARLRLNIFFFSP